MDGLGLRTPVDWIALIASAIAIGDPIRRLLQGHPPKHAPIAVAATAALVMMLLGVAVVQLPFITAVNTRYGIANGLALAGLAVSLASLVAAILVALQQHWRWLAAVVSVAGIILYPFAFFSGALLVYFLAALVPLLFSFYAPKAER
jgi:hypothetical protein